MFFFTRRHDKPHQQCGFQHRSIATRVPWKRKAQGFAVALESPHTNWRTGLQVFCLHCWRVWNMNNRWFCWAKACEHRSSLICGPFIRLSLHPSLIILSLFLVVSSHPVSLLCFNFLIILYLLSVSFHFLLFVVSRGTRVPSAIVMATTLGRQDGGLISGLAAFMEENF